ncbi:hypothetical protein U1Q18_044040, partial [Sarracenia purpurea var. burkii]
MVSKTDEEQVNRLENQVDNGGGGAWDYLCLVRKLKLRRSDKVLKHGLSILNDSNKRSSLGPEVYRLHYTSAARYEDVSIRHPIQDFNETRQSGRIWMFEGSLGLYSTTKKWTLYEQVAIAAMDCQCLDVAKDCIKVLQKKFPDSKRV